MEADTLYDLGELAKLVGLSVGLTIFIVLISLDMRKAFKKGIHWIPGRALVLSALSIQLLTFLGALNASPKYDPSRFDQFSPANSIAAEALLADSVKNELLMIHIGRVMICVFVGYLLPGMARAASKNYRTRIVALLFSISIQIVSEIYAINRRSENTDENSVVYTGEKSIGLSITVTTATVLGSMLVLLLLLSCATLASKSIKDIISQKIPVILSYKNMRHGEENSWQMIEDQVLKSWIVIRVCHPEYIVARSVLVSCAGLVVTICILVAVVGWGMEGISKHFKTRFDWLKFTAIALECLFIVMGWAVICCRWVTAVIYYGRRPSNSVKSWTAAWFRVEDFWTRQIFDQLDADESRLVSGKKDILRVRPMRKRIWLPRELLPVLILLQIGIVLLSKGCWFISEMVFCNRYFMRKFFMKQWKGLAADADYNKFREALEDMHMPGEKTDSVWIANRKSIQQAKNLIMEGCEDGRKCRSLITFLKEKTSQGRAGLRCLRPELLGSCDLKYLCRLDPGKLRVEKYFAYAQKQCWKMTAVALINIIVILSPLDGNGQYTAPSGRRRFKVATDAMEAYSQAWEIMDLVDESRDPETHLMSRAADKLFDCLKADVEFRYWDSLQTDSESKIMEMARDAIGKLAEKGQKKANAEELRHDSMDWKEIAAGNSLYKLCMSIEFKEGNVRELLDEVVSSLADVIDCCMEKAADALVVNSRRWARGLNEEEVSKSLYIAGKTRGLMEELVKKPKLTDASKFDDSLPVDDTADLVP